MPKIILPAALAERAGGTGEVSVEAPTAGEALVRLIERHPGLAHALLDRDGHPRRHLHLFVGDRRLSPEGRLGAGDRVELVQAVAGGAEPLPFPDPAEDAELLVGTKKGLFVLRGPRRGPMEVVVRCFPGEVVEFATVDPRSGTYFASVTHGQFGPHLYLTDDPESGDWREASGPAFPEGTDASVTRTWVVEPGAEEGLLWAGVAPAALFSSTDGGDSWELVRALWDHPTRPQWEGGFGGLCLHSICPWPGEPERLAVGISAAGVWLTDDGGASWRRGVQGLMPRYVPEEARADTLSHCVHNMKRSPVEPETLYMQFHGGVYRSDDAGASWVDISRGLPADFGFPLAIDPKDPDRAFVIPLVSDMDRVTPEGRVRVYETRDRGASWNPLSHGLPQEDAYLTILRQAFATDAHEPLGLFFGAESGEVFSSADDGETWHTLADHLPPVYSVRCSR